MRAVKCSYPSSSGTIIFVWSQYPSMERLIAKITFLIGLLLVLIFFRGVFHELCRELINAPGSGIAAVVLISSSVCILGVLSSQMVLLLQFGYHICLCQCRQTA